jgi:chromate transport protein ChrA
MTALSIPTWVIHISSVLEWVVAIWLIWNYATVSGNRAWQGLAIAMLPALVSAMCACTWHFFDNATNLEWLTTLQAAMTLVGNITLCIAGWWIWQQARTRPSDSTSAHLNSLKQP